MVNERCPEAVYYRYRAVLPEPCNVLHPVHGRGTTLHQLRRSCNRAGGFLGWHFTGVNRIADEALVKLALRVTHIQVRCGVKSGRGAEQVVRLYANVVCKRLARGRFQTQKIHDGI